MLPGSIHRVKNTFDTSIFFLDQSQSNLENIVFTDYLSFITPTTSNLSIPAEYEKDTMND